MIFAIAMTVFWGLIGFCLAIGVGSFIYQRKEPNKKWRR